MEIERRIRLASGEIEAELVLKNLNIVNVFTGDIVSADIAIDSGIIVGVGKYSGKSEVDMSGKTAVPGLINAHCHVESSMVTPQEYCREELLHGVTTLITDPHEIANVAGKDGINFMLESTKRLPINYFIQLPSCVPSTSLEHSGAVLSANDLSGYIGSDMILGLGEMMDYNGVLSCSHDVIQKLKAFSGHVVDGHAPSLTGQALQGYVAAGITTDHESVTFEEAREKLNSGIAVLVREGSASKNLTDIISGVVQSGIQTRRMAFCTDDKHLSDIRREGTILHNVKLSRALGLDILEAIQMATINAAEIYSLAGLGAISVGYRADIVILNDLDSLSIHSVYKDGLKVVENGKILVNCFSKQAATSERVMHSVHLPEISEASLALPQRLSYPAIKIIPGQIITDRIDIPANEVPSAISSGSIRKIAVVERHFATGNIGIGLISGYGLHHGAVATTVAHDSHNLIIVGDNDDDMIMAAEALANCNGGYVIVEDGHILGLLPLEIAGLMSSLPADNFISKLDNMLKTARLAGIADGIDPFTTLSFMALPVLPKLRITDAGLIDTVKYKILY